MEIGFWIWEIVMTISLIGAAIWEIKNEIIRPGNCGGRKDTNEMKQKKLYPMSYERRLQRYHEEKQQLLKKNPMMSPTELDKVIKKLADKWKI